MIQTPVLVLNAGSSSLKYQLVVPETAEVQAEGIIERIGETGNSIADHDAAMRTMEDQLAAAGVDLDTLGLRAVGHRVVHGGPNFSDPTIIDDDVLDEIKDLIPLAPLHNPGAVSGIGAARLSSRYPTLRSSIPPSSALCRRPRQRTRFLVILPRNIGSGAMASTARRINTYHGPRLSWLVVILGS